MTESTLKVNLVDFDPQGDPTDNSLTPIREVKKVHIGIKNFQVIQIGSGLS